MVEHPRVEVAALGQRVRLNGFTAAQEEGLKQYCETYHINQIFDPNDESYVFNTPLPIDLIKSLGGEIIYQNLPLVSVKK